MVNYKIEWSIEARSDLIDILEFYITQNGTATYSVKLNSKINKSIQLLSKNPLMGTITEYDAIRVLATGDYQIIYEIFNQLILIVMIWDCRRNPEGRVIDKRIK